VGVCRDTGLQRDHSSPRANATVPVHVLRLHQIPAQTQHSAAGCQVVSRWWWLSPCYIYICFLYYFTLFSYNLFSYNLFSLHSLFLLSHFTLLFLFSPLFPSLLSQWCPTRHVIARLHQQEASHREQGECATECPGSHGTIHHGRRFSRHTIHIRG